MSSWREKKRKGERDGRRHHRVMERERVMLRLKKTKVEREKETPVSSGSEGDGDKHAATVIIE